MYIYVRMEVGHPQRKSNEREKQTERTREKKCRAAGVDHKNCTKAFI